MTRGLRNDKVPHFRFPPVGSALKVSNLQSSDYKSSLTFRVSSDDMTFGPKLRQDAEAVFAARKGKDDFVDYEFRDYKGNGIRMFLCLS